MRKILNWINKDGAMHMLCCFAIVTAAGHIVNIGIAVFVAVFAAFFKEIIWDAWMGRGTFEWHDIACDLFGTLIGAVLVLIGGAV